MSNFLWLSELFNKHCWLNITFEFGTFPDTKTLLLLFIYFILIFLLLLKTVKRCVHNIHMFMISLYFLSSYSSLEWYFPTILVTQMWPYNLSDLFVYCLEYLNVWSQLLSFAFLIEKKIYILF